MRYRPDPKAQRDAQEAYDNAVYEHRLKIKRDEVQAIQDEINNYQKEIDKYNEQIELIDKKIEKLEEEKEINQERIEKIQEENEKLDEIIEKIDERYQKEIDRIEEYKQKWQELLEIQEQIADLEVLSSLGIDLNNLINLDPSVFDNFKNQYTDTLKNLYDANQHYADAFNDVLGAGLDLNTEKMGGLEKAAQSFKDTLSDVDGANSGGSSLSGLNTGIDDASDGMTTLSTNTNNAETDVKELDTAAHNAFVAWKTGIEENYEATHKGLDDTEKKLLQTFGIHEEKLKIMSDKSKEPGTELGNSYEKGCNTAITAINGVETELDNLPTEKTITIKTEGSSISGNSVTPEAKGTVGNAFASGYPGLKHSEVALRSEYGQPELTVYPNGKYELTTEPTMSKLPKDTVIFNESQTKRILKNGKKGNAFAEGTSFRPLEEVMPDKAELFSRFEANLTNNLSTIQSSLDIISRNTAEINSNLANKITNNNVGMSYVNNGDIHITCPGVTSQEVLDNITEQLNNTFFGMATNSYQRAMKRG